MPDVDDFYRGGIIADDPSDDPMFTSFLAPEWLGYGDDKWVCVPSVALFDGGSIEDRMAHADDSY